MTLPAKVAIGFASVCVALLVAALWVVFTPQSIDAPPPVAVTSPAESDASARKIKARLFYVAEDGAHLKPVEQEVVYAADTVDQARAILALQLAPPPAPLTSAIPAATNLRALYVTPQGQAYVDLSADVAAGHPGGSLDEMLTVYTVVHALTENLPAITSVQLLVDGKEVDTLAGHLDLRQPLAKRPSINAAIE